MLQYVLTVQYLNVTYAWPDLLVVCWGAQTSWKWSTPGLESTGTIAILISRVFVCRVEIIVPYSSILIVVCGSEGSPRCAISREADTVLGVEATFNGTAIYGDTVRLQEIKWNEEENCLRHK